MQIKREDKGHKGSFYIEEAGERLAEMTFSLAGDHRIIIDHTEVSDALRGKGAGKQLVRAAVEWARDTDKKYFPFVLSHVLFLKRFLSFRMCGINNEPMNLGSGKLKLLTDYHITVYNNIHLVFATKMFTGSEILKTMTFSKVNPFACF